MTKPKNPLVVARRSYIGGSDIASVLGISPYTSPVELYLRKRGEADEQPDDPVLRRGRRLEPYVADMYKEDTGRRVEGPAFVLGREPWIGANLDGTSGVDVGKIDRVLEIKTANPFTRRDWGEPGTDQIPVYYTAQVQWMLGITRFARADVAALIGLDDFRIYTVEADHALQEMLVARAREFWWRVHEGKPPEPTSPEDVALLFPEHRTGAVVEANDVDLETLGELKGVKQQMAELEQREASLKMALQQRLGDAEALTLDEVQLCTWRTQQRKTIDSAQLRERYPAIAEEVEKVGRSRVFRIK